ncbi:MAG: M48 family peptidase, partial [Pyrinomonadaceae bacterium]
GIKKPTLTWSLRGTFRRLGHHDAAHETIVISKSLDDKKVPRYVVEFVVFHEMLHIFHPAKIQNGRRYHHTPVFRRDEKKFAFYEESEKWIGNNSRFLKRKARL